MICPRNPFTLTGAQTEKQFKTVNLEAWAADFWNEEIPPEQSPIEILTIKTLWLGICKVIKPRRDKTMPRRGKILMTLDADEVYDFYFADRGALDNIAKKLALCYPNNAILRQTVSSELT